MKFNPGMRLVGVWNNFRLWSSVVYGLHVFARISLPMSKQQR